MIADKTGARIIALPDAKWLPADEGVQLVHFGYRDGLAQVGIEGWTKQHKLDAHKQVSKHAAGEFVLGHPQNSGANP